MRKIHLLACLCVSLSLSAQVVLFPGDANNDGRADQYDILPIGVAYGAEGFFRPDASLEWIPQFHPMQWLQTLPTSSIDLAFVDCDGNGFIDSLDIDAIAFNFDSMQLDADPAPLPYLLPDTCFTCPQPDLLITFDRDTAMAQDTFYAFLTLQYPPNVPPPDGALGIAFELNYDSQNVKDSLTKVFPDTMPGDLMFVTATSTLATAWRSVPPGQIRFGAAGKGNNALFAPRFLGAVEIVVEDMIIRSPVTEIEFWMEASKILIINDLEQVVSLGKVVVDTLLLFDPLDAAGEVQLQLEVKISPNPATETVNFSCANSAVEAVEVFNLAGRQILREEWPAAHTQQLWWAYLPPGQYFAKIKTQHGEVLRRVAKL